MRLRPRLCRSKDALQRPEMRFVLYCTLLGTFAGSACFRSRNMHWRACHGRQGRRTREGDGGVLLRILLRAVCCNSGFGRRCVPELRTSRIPVQLARDFRPRCAGRSRSATAPLRLRIGEDVVINGSGDALRYLWLRRKKERVPLFFFYVRDPMSVQDECQKSAGHDDKPDQVENIVHDAALPWWRLNGNGLATTWVPGWAGRDRGRH